MTNSNITRIHLDLHHFVENFCENGFPDSCRISDPATHNKSISSCRKISHWIMPRRRNCIQMYTEMFCVPWKINILKQIIWESQKWHENCSKWFLSYWSKHAKHCKCSVQERLKNYLANWNFDAIFDFLRLRQYWICFRMCLWGLLVFLR